MAEHIVCPFCFGTGKVYKDVGDDNDVELRCDDCRGTGISRDIVIDGDKIVRNVEGRDGL